MSYWRQELRQMDITNNRSDEEIDDALITDSVKKLLSDSGTNYDLAADILSTNAQSVVNVNPIHCSGATVQEGMDLVDALDTLVQHLSRENNNKETIEPNNDSINALDIVLLDHNYCQPICQTFVRPVSDVNTTPVKTETLEIKPKPFETTDKKSVNTTQPSVQLSSSASTTSTACSSPSNSSTGNKSPKTPTASRRSQRQIDKIEKSVLEKIKAENQEMLKREKESMVSMDSIEDQLQSMSKFHSKIIQLIKKNFFL
jgi:hypothetical protein